MQENRQMCKNLINTAKYTLFNFIPLNLFNQFKKVQNIYFVFITCMQTIESISISNQIPTVGYNLVPLVILSMIKDAFEDYKRHKSDAEENNKMAKVYD